MFSEMGSSVQGDGTFGGIDGHGQVAEVVAGRAAADGDEADARLAVAVLAQLVGVEAVARGVRHGSAQPQKDSQFSLMKATLKAFLIPMERST